MNKLPKKSENLITKFTRNRYNTINILSQSIAEQKKKNSKGLSTFLYVFQNIIKTMELTILHKPYFARESKIDIGYCTKIKSVPR